MGKASELDSTCSPLHQTDERGKNDTMDASLREHAAAAAYQQQQQQEQQRQQLHQQQHLYQQQSHFPQQQTLHQQAYQQHHRGVGSAGGSLSGQLSLASLPQQQHLHQQQQHQHHDFMSVGSHYSRGSHASSQTSSVVDEAYRRLGHRLSRRAHGDQPFTRPKRVQSLGLQPSSVFAQYLPQKMSAGDGGRDSKDSEEVDTKSPKSPSSNGLIINNRTNKVAKTRYSDHGDHQHKIPSQKGNILKKMTIHCKDHFRLWQAEIAASRGKGRKKRVVSSSTQQQQQSKPQEQHQSHQNGDISPQRFAFSQLALEAGGGPRHVQEDKHLAQHARHQQGHMTHGLLSAVIEQSSQTSSHAHSKGTASIGSNPSSIATKSTMGSKSDSIRTPALPQGKCLTQPPEPIANDGLDNCEGNLIVFENDTIRVGRKQIHAIAKEKIRNVSKMEFRIQSLLGQGTFAQVFQCVHLQTGKLVAVKVVKNKPAYTRQAVVEIDVFRALSKTDESSKAISSSQSQHTATPQRAGSPAVSISGSSATSTGTKWDYMVNLECYFMFKSHLCLVFELLGLNLYEVLKRRQFRGLPLSIVRTLVRQAIRGIKELSQKSIVHCDLKPENILLVSEDDVESVVSAGEGRRQSGSRDKSKSPLSAGQRNKSLSSSLERKNENSTGRQVKTSGLTSALSRSGTTTPTGSSTTDPVSNSPSNSAVTSSSFPISLRQKIKLIDFGSACFEGQTSHTYIQSRFYRSPEVLVGLPYDSGIDIWSLGCVAAELFLGLPILPGVHEHDQLCRITEMIAKLPGWMLDSGSKSSKYFVKYMLRAENRKVTSPSPPPSAHSVGSPSPRPLPPQWRVKTQQEYIASLSQSEIRKKGGLAKLEKQPTNRYFKRKKLADIIMHKGQSNTAEDHETLQLFVHFLYGLLDPDPWKRWTAHQACQHPFVTGGTVERRSNTPQPPEASKDQNQANTIGDICWEPPWDPGICRRKLLNVQKTRERQQASRRYSSSRRSSLGNMEANEGSVGGRREPSPPGKVSESGGAADLGTATSGQAEQRPHFQMSSSLSDYVGDPGMLGRIAGEGLAPAGDTGSSQVFSLGAQSFSEMASFSGATGSLNEPDFAYALQRPGVVPMGADSVASSVDLHSHHQLQPGSGSYGGSHRMHTQSQLRENSGNIPITSRSYDMGDSGFPSDQWHARPGSLSHMSTSSQGSFAAPFEMNGMGGTPGSNLLRDLNEAQNQVTSSFPQELSIPGSEFQQQHSEFQQQHAAYGHAQAAYLQQQHAALQQQQALLQQQQAALALQQEQLRAYGINTPGMGMNFNASLPNSGIGALPGNGTAAMPNSQMNQLPTHPMGAVQNAGLGGVHDMNLGVGGMTAAMNTANTGMNQLVAMGGYYYVSSADGTQMMASAAAIGQQGLTPPYGVGPPQVPGNMPAYPNGVDNSNARPDQGGYPTPPTSNYHGMNM